MRVGFFFFSFFLMILFLRLTARLYISELGKIVYVGTGSREHPQDPVGVEGPRRGRAPKGESIDRGTWRLRRSRRLPSRRPTPLSDSTLYQKSDDRVLAERRSSLDEKTGTLFFIIK